MLKYMKILNVFLILMVLNIGLASKDSSFAIISNSIFEKYQPVNNKIVSFFTTRNTAKSSLELPD